MAEYMKSMQTQMTAMRGMMSPDGTMGHGQGGAAMDPDAAAKMRTMQQRMKDMETTMDQAQKAKTPAEREKLMAGHMKSMQTQMTAMHDMMGAEGRMAHGPGGAATDSNAALQLPAMQHRMNMMQQMMEHMVLQQQLSTKPIQ